MQPADSATRKATPIYSGVLRYFPDALAAVARLSKAGNDKHNPGEPLHWSREKSTDHGDCIVRHQLEPEAIDAETGELHAASVAWRALAQLQLLEEAKRTEALTGPMGRVEPAPGAEWEVGKGYPPSWVSGPTVLVEYRPTNCQVSDVCAASALCWVDSYEYRLAQ